MALNEGVGNEQDYREEFGFFEACDAIGLIVYSFDESGQTVQLTGPAPWPLSNPVTLKKHGDPLRRCIT